MGHPMVSICIYTVPTKQKPGSFEESLDEYTMSFIASLYILLAKDQNKQYMLATRVSPWQYTGSTGISPKQSCFFQSITVCRNNADRNINNKSALCHDNNQTVTLQKYPPTWNPTPKCRCSAEQSRLASRQSRPSKPSSPPSASSAHKYM